MSLEATLADVYVLGEWVESHYVKGMMIREDDGTIRPLKMFEGYCNRHWRSNRCEQAKQKIERYGCCLELCERYAVHVEDPDDHDPATRTRTVLYCGRTEEPCPRAQLEDLVSLLSILNSEHIYEHSSHYV